MRKKRKKSKRPVIFVQEYGTYTNEVLVAAGAAKEQVLSFLKRIKAKKDYIEWLRTDEKIWQLGKEKKGLFAWNDNVEGTLLLLRPHEDAWEYAETLIHELHHLVQVFSKKAMMENEMEAQAYLQEFLFRSIRQKLQKVEKS